MGDRALLQVINSKEPGEFSPVVYLHWAGDSVPDIVRELKRRMASRPGDTSYAAARLVQIAIGDDKGNISYGIWNAKKPLTKEQSHGDAGVVLIDCSDGFKCQCLGGYLVVDDEGLPALPERR
jgi:hypothetical protein